MPGARLTMNLSEATRGDVGAVGGKSASLGDLIHGGFPVPDGFIVTTDAYTLFLDENGLYQLFEEALRSVHYSDSASVEGCSSTIMEAVRRAELPSVLQAEIKEKYRKMGEPLVAVRSSATSEDLPTSSFAGQLETYLNIGGVGEVMRHVKLCLAGLWTARAISYRHGQGIPHEASRIAVLVQRMLPASSAGVMFTVSPLNPDGSELLIESNFGLGESLVSGRATPDRFIVGRRRDGPPEILGREIGDKRIAASASAGGVEYVELRGEEGRRPSLTDDQVIGLASTGLRIEAALGSPQDVEWATGAEGGIVILQSRPITALPATGDEDVVWSRGYSDDYWNDNVTPLYFELLGDHLTKIVNNELNGIMGYTMPKGKRTDQLLRLHKAHAYFNLEVLKRKVEYEIPPFLRNDDILNYFPEGSGPYGKETMKGMPFSLWRRVYAEVRVMLMDPNGSTAKTADAYDRWTAEAFKPFWDGFESKMLALEGGPASGYLSLADELDDLMVSHFRLVRYGIPVHNIGMNLLTQYLLARFLGREEGSKAYPVLISGLSHKTSETNMRVERLAASVRSSPELKEMVLGSPSSELSGLLRSSPNPEAAGFLAEFDSFMREFGVRGFTRETYYPRWGEAPEYVFDALKALVSEELHDLGAVEERNRALREETEAEVKRRIRSQSLGWAKWRLFSMIMGAARRYIIFREDQRFNLDRWITMNRRIHMKVGEAFRSKGVLDEPGDIFFLTKAEVRGISGAGPEESARIRELVASRRAEFLRYEDTIPPKFIQGSREFNDPPPVGGVTMRGLPASRGILTAPVRVLHSVQEIWQVRTGEILVVPRTDPGWTPVFSKIGGLITETGGVLSHGAVVSREYGIPAVTNVADACALFRTGQVVTIDGVEGVVTVERR
jgi:phosphohistidine swiveling domain-containing protein